MIRNLLATTAIATLVATGAAYAQAPATTDTAPIEQPAANIIHAEGHLASNIIGETVYNGTGDNAENIGSVTDLVLSPEGDLEAVVIGVGGFLGLGQKNVAIEYDAFEWATIGEDRYLVVTATREQLEQLPEFDTAAFSPQSADAQIGNTRPATAQELGLAAATPGAAPAAPVDGTVETPLESNVDTPSASPAPPANDVAQTPPPVTQTPVPGDATVTSTFDRSTAMAFDVSTVGADELIGTTVYGANDENVGSINDVILTDEAVDVVIVDVGGFLGIGAKSVALDIDNLDFLRDESGNLHLSTPFTSEQLEAQPEYDEATFTTQRDQQILITPVN